MSLNVTVVILFMYMGGVNMKKKLAILLSVFLVVLIGTILIIYKNPISTDVLSEEKIAMLRDRYPINDGTSALYDMMVVPLEQYIELCDSYIEVEVVSKPNAYVKRYNLAVGSPEGVVNEKTGNLSEDTWIKCKVRILNDIWDSIQEDTIEITYNSIFEVGMPSMEIGSRFIIGGEYNIETDMLNISSNTMFYVTDDDYVLSVKSEESKNRYSGYKVDDFVEYIREEKK